jgi:hypothetical protein
MAGCKVSSTQEYVLLDCTDAGWAVQFAGNAVTWLAVRSAQLKSMYCLIALMQVGQYSLQELQSHYWPDRQQS